MSTYFKFLLSLLMLTSVSFGVSAQEDEDEADDVEEVVVTGSRIARTSNYESVGPVVKEFPVSISPTDHEPMVCALPPRMNTDLHPAVDEAKALKSAYDRAHQKNNRTSVGMIISAEEIPAVLERFVRIVEGEDWDKVGFPEKSMYPSVHDIRSYYEELACELAEGPIEPWATEEWFYDQTEAGKLILNARRMMRDKKAEQSIWFGLAPAGRE